MMPIINFDERFADFVSEWVTAHQDEYSNNTSYISLSILRYLPIA